MITEYRPTQLILARWAAKCLGRPAFVFGTDAVWPEGLDPWRLPFHLFCAAGVVCRQCLVLGLSQEDGYQLCRVSWEATVWREQRFSIQLSRVLEPRASREYRVMKYGLREAVVWSI